MADKEAPPEQTAGEPKPKLLTAADILAQKKLPTKYVHDVWGGTVKVQGLTGRQRDLFEQSFLRIHGNVRTITMEHARARLVSMAVIDEQGNRVFTESQIQELSELSALDLDKVFTVAQELSGLGDEQLREMVTTLGNAPSSGGGTA